MTWFKGLSWLWRIVVIAALILFAFLAWNFVDDYFSKDDEVRAELSENQTEAAVESGRDTVNTITKQYEKETIRTETVREIQGRVNEAPDAHSAHTAGIDGLCVVSPDLCPQG